MASVQCKLDRRPTNHGYIQPDIRQCSIRSLNHLHFLQTQVFLLGETGCSARAAIDSIRPFEGCWHADTFRIMDARFLSTIQEGEDRRTVLHVQAVRVGRGHRDRQVRVDQGLPAFLRSWHLL